MKKQPISDIHPFALSEKIYFVGSTRVSVHFLKTTKGLVMIDTGYPDMGEQILDSMEYLGLDPTDICAIVHTHAHYDHFGNTHLFRKLSGAKTYISRIDNAVINGSYRKDDINKCLGTDTVPFFDCDVLLEDGDVVEFGDTSIRFLLTPGHTDGTMTLFITTTSNGQPMIAAMHGGVGRNTMNLEYLTKYGLSTDCREVFRQGLHRLASEHVDLVLGNHPPQNDTEGKLARVLVGESVIDPTEWNRFLTYTEEKIEAMLAEEAAAK